MNAVWLAGLMQSLPSGMPRIAAISGVIFAAGQHAAEAGLRALRELDLDRADLGGGDDLERRAPVENRPLVVAAAEVAGADLPDELAALAVVIGDAALAGVLQRARERDAAVDRLDAAAPTASRSSSPRC